MQICPISNLCLSRRYANVMTVVRVLLRLMTLPTKINKHMLPMQNPLIIQVIVIELAIFFFVTITTMIINLIYGAIIILIFFINDSLLSCIISIVPVEMQTFMIFCHSIPNQREIKKNINTSN